MYEPECSDGGGGGDIGLNGGPRGDGEAISVGDTGASAAVVNLTGIGQPPRDGDGEAIGDASRDHSNTLAADIMTGRIAYIRPFSGVITGVPIIPV